MSFIDTSYNFTTILAGVLLWIIFSIIGDTISCDIRRIVKNNPYIKHILGIIVYFFLFSVVLNNSNTTHIYYIWIYTIIIYVCILMLSKSQWYTAFPVIILIVIDQSLQLQSQYLNDPTQFGEARSIIQYILYGLLVIGFIIYLVRQKIEFGENFSFKTFMLDTTCKS